MYHIVAKHHSKCLRALWNFACSCVMKTVESTTFKDRTHPHHSPFHLPFLYLSLQSRFISLFSSPFHIPLYMSFNIPFPLPSLFRLPYIHYLFLPVPIAAFSFTVRAPRNLYEPAHLTTLCSINMTQNRYLEISKLFGLIFSVLFVSTPS